MPKAIAFRPTDEQAVKIDEIMQSRNFSQTDALKHMLDTYLQKDAQNQADDVCPSLIYLDENWCCVKGRQGRTVQIKKIGEALDQVRKACKACTRDLGLLAENKALREQSEKGIIIKIPSCRQGGQLSEDGQKLYCNRITEYVDVKKYCKVLRKGANCTDLKWTTLIAKGNLPEPDNR